MKLTAVAGLLYPVAAYPECPASANLFSADSLCFQWDEQLSTGPIHSKGGRALLQTKAQLARVDVDDFDGDLPAAPAQAAAMLREGDAAHPEVKLFASAKLSALQTPEEQRPVTAEPAPHAMHSEEADRPSVVAAAGDVEAIAAPPAATEAKADLDKIDAPQGATEDKETEAARATAEAEVLQAAAAIESALEVVAGEATGETAAEADAKDRALEEEARQENMIQEARRQRLRGSAKAPPMLSPVSAVLGGLGELLLQRQEGILWLGALILCVGFLLLAVLWVPRRAKKATPDPLAEELTAMGVEKEDIPEGKELVSSLPGRLRIEQGGVRLCEKLAELGGGEVWSGVWKSQHVSVKVIPEEGSRIAALQGFCREVLNGWTVRSQNVVMIYGYAVEAPWSLCVIRERVDRTLEDIAASGAIEPLVALRMALDVANGVAAIHQVGLCHRELSPSTIFVTSEGCKVDGFSNSLIVDDKAAPRARLAPESLNYASPEVLTCDDQTEACDVYSLGCIIWRLLSGQRPWAHLRPEQFIGVVGWSRQQLQLDEAWDPSIRQLLSAALGQPAHRPTMSQMAIAIKRMIVHLEGAVHPGHVEEQKPVSCGTQGDAVVKSWDNHHYETKEGLPGDGLSDVISYGLSEPDREPEAEDCVSAC
mmetsp:Transcript_6002/g.14329  ORF Transcript_6002/g.14329 Transcript_6002/m.14329 type:complete len:652 (-) Transcript_6002:45-2000(-)